MTQGISTLGLQCIDMYCGKDIVSQTYRPYTYIMGTNPGRVELVFAASYKEHGLVGMKLW